LALKFRVQEILKVGNDVELVIMRIYSPSRLEEREENDVGQPGYLRRLRKLYGLILPEKTNN